MIFFVNCVNGKIQKRTGKFELFTTRRTEMSKNNTNPFIAIATMIGSFCVGVVALFLVFSPQNISPIGWVIVPMCALGIGLGYFAGKNNERN